MKVPNGPTPPRQPTPRWPILLHLCILTIWCVVVIRASGRSAALHAIVIATPPLAAAMLMIMMRVTQLRGLAARRARLDALSRIADLYSRQPPPHLTPHGADDAWTASLTDFFRNARRIRQSADSGKSHDNLPAPSHYPLVRIVQAWRDHRRRGQRP